MIILVWYVYIQNYCVDFLHLSNWISISVSDLRNTSKIGPALIWKHVADYILLQCVFVKVMLNNMPNLTIVQTI